MRLYLLDQDVPVASERVIRVEVLGENQHPTIAGLNKIFISEDDPNFSENLSQYAFDAEEALVDEDGPGGNVDNIPLMQWYFLPQNLGIQIFRKCVDFNDCHYIYYARCLFDSR